MPGKSRMRWDDPRRGRIIYDDSNWETVARVGNGERVHAWKALGVAVRKADGRYFIPRGLPSDWSNPREAGRTGTYNG
jgi:hypothetical protein